MTYLTALYDMCLAVLLFSHVKYNRTRLREDIERMIPYIKPVVQKNRYWHLVFDDDLSKSVADMKDKASSKVSPSQSSTNSSERISQHEPCFVCLFICLI